MWLKSNPLSSWWLNDTVIDCITDWYIEWWPCFVVSSNHQPRPSGFQFDMDDMFDSIQSLSDQDSTDDSISSLQTCSSEREFTNKRISTGETDNIIIFSKQLSLSWVHVPLSLVSARDQFYFYHELMSGLKDSRKSPWLLKYLTGCLWILLIYCVCHPSRTRPPFI